MKKLAQKLDFTNLYVAVRPVTISEKVMFLRVVARSLAARMSNARCKQVQQAANRAYWADIRESGVFKYPE